MLDVKNAFSIRYIKLHFVTKIIDNGAVPVYKESAMRGGMGEMLLRTNCVRDRECEACDFESECIVRHTLYSKMEIQPPFMTSGDSVGYVIECADHRDKLIEGDNLEFNLILLGKTICLFSQFLNALYALGMAGLGKDKVRYSIMSIITSSGDSILNGNDVLMENFKIHTVSDYIGFRKQQILDKKDEVTIKFLTPTTIKYRDSQIAEFKIEALLEACCRRIYMLDCFEGIHSDIHELEYTNSLIHPTITYEEHKRVKVRRYSNHQKGAMYLRGIEGTLKLKGVTEECLDILIACELLHVGKNTSFGFGSYIITL